MTASEGLEISTEENQERLLRFEQVKLLYEAIPVSIVATLISSLVLVLVEWKVVDHTMLTAWLVGVFHPYFNQCDFGISKYSAEYCVAS